MRTFSKEHHQTTIHFRETAMMLLKKQMDETKEPISRTRGEQWLNLYFYEPARLCWVPDYGFDEDGFTPERFANAAFDAARCAAWAY